MGTNDNASRSLDAPGIQTTAPAAFTLYGLWPLLLVAYGFFFWRSIYGMRSAWLHLLDWIVIVIPLVVWTVAGWRRRRTWPATSLDRPLVVILVLIAFSCLFFTHIRTGLLHTWEIFTLILLFWLLVDMIRQGWARTLWRLLYMIAGVVCLISAIEFLAWYFGWPLLPGANPGWFSIGGWQELLPPVMHRLSLALANATALSAFLALLIPPALGILLSSRDWDTRIGMALWIVAALLITGFSLSRGGLLALGVSSVVFALGASRSPFVRKRWSRGTIYIVGTVVGIAALGLVVGILLMSQQVGHPGADTVRFDLWRSAAGMLHDFPLTGVGAGEFGPALRAYRNPLLSSDYIHTAHNLYLNIAAETGIPGLLAFLWLGLSVGRAWWTRWRDVQPGDPDWWRTLGIGAALLGLAVQSVFDVFTEPAILLTILFFVAQFVTPHSEPAPTQYKRMSWRWATALVLLLAAVPLLVIDSAGFVVFQRSLAQTIQGDTVSAIQSAERAHSIDPWLPLYDCHLGYVNGLSAAQGNVDARQRALTAYERCTAGEDIPGWTDYLNEALLDWEDGQPQQVWQSLDRAVTFEPLHWELWLNRGLLAEHLGYRQETIRSYAWVLNIDPRLAGSPFWLAGDRTAMWPDIIQAGREVTEKRGQDYQKWQWQVEAAANHCQEIVPDLELYLKSFPDDALASRLLSQCLLAGGHPEEAIVWLDAIRQNAPPTAAVFLARGQANLAQGQLDSAKRDFSTALFLDTGCVEAHLGLAQLAQQRGDFATAEREYGRALRSTIVIHGYDLVLYGRAGWPVVLPQATRIGLRHDYLLGETWGGWLEEQGQVEQARQIYSAILLLDPYLEPIRHRLELLD